MDSLAPRLRRLARGSSRGPDLRIIEVCSVRDDKIYREGHIPGAMWVYWKSACWHETDRDFITPAALAKMLGGMGIGPQSTVVL